MERVWLLLFCCEGTGEWLCVTGGIPMGFPQFSMGVRDKGNQGSIEFLAGLKGMQDFPVKSQSCMGVQDKKGF